MKKLKEKLEDASAVHGVASLTNIQTMLEALGKWFMKNMLLPIQGS